MRAELDLISAGFDKLPTLTSNANKLVLVNTDATGLLVVLSAWVGDLIRGAPEHMRDHLFMSFADSAATIAGIKADDEQDAETMQ